MNNKVAQEVLTKTVMPTLGNILQDVCSSQEGRARIANNAPYITVVNRKGAAPDFDVGEGFITFNADFKRSRCTGSWRHAGPIWTAPMTWLRKRMPAITKPKNSSHADSRKAYSNWPGSGLACRWSKNLAERATWLAV